MINNRIARQRSYAIDVVIRTRIYRRMTKLREWRERRNLSQPQAAKLLRTPVQTLRNWEQKRTTPPPVLDVALEALDNLDDLSHPSDQDYRE